MKILVILLMLLTFSNAHSDELEYPELLVTPSASKRLLMEAQLEKQNSLYLHLTIQIPALLNVYVSQTLNEDEAKARGISSDEIKNAKNAGLYVGVGWLVTTAFLSATYTPYVSGYRKIEKIPTNTKSNQLTKERLAEEALEEPAKLASRLSILSTLTNFGVAAYMNNKGDDQNRLFSSLAMVTSLAPFIFEYRWQSVYQKHLEYKKKIYGPVTINGIIIEPQSMTLMPGINVALTF